MDVLTDVLSSMRLSSDIFCRTELSAPWGIGIPVIDGAVFHVVDRGNCWLKLEGEDELIPLSGGDLVVLPQSRNHEILDSPDSLATSVMELVKLRGEESYNLSFGGGGAPTTLVCGVFYLQEGGDDTIFSMLPPFIHIKGEQGSLGRMTSFGAGFPDPASGLGRLTQLGPTIAPGRNRRR